MLKGHYGQHISRKWLPYYFLKNEYPVIGHYHVNTVCDPLKMRGMSFGMPFNIYFKQLDAVSGRRLVVTFFLDENPTIFVQKPQTFWFDITFVRQPFIALYKYCFEMNF